VGVTAYASLLPGFERELTDIRIDQTMRAIDVAMNYADRSTAKLSDRGRGRVAQAALPDQDELQVALDKIETAKRRLEALFEEGGAEHSRLHGLLASTEKRRGEVYFFLSKNAQAAAADYRLESKKSLLNARHSYWQAFLANRSNSWGVVQYLSLDLVLRNATVEGIEGEVPDTGESNDPAALWSLAHVLSLNDLTSAEGPQFEWALGNLVELYMLGLFIPEALAGKGAGREAELTDRATARARELVSHAGANSFEVYSTRRQILRYLEWYQQMSAIGQITNAAEQVFNALPEAYQPAWAS
jgi:hypothetical protein